jgi:hypothetical protein
MDEQKDAGQKKETTPAEVPPPALPPIDPSQAPPNPEPEEDERKDKPKQSSTISDKVMVWATCVIAAGTLVSAGAIVLQWREMVGGGTQTDQIISAANGIKRDQGQLVRDNEQALADNRQALLESLKENRTEFGNALRQNREALDASARQSKAALDATVTASNAQNKILSDQLATTENAVAIDQRPWVGIDAMAVVDRWYWDPVNRAYNLTVSFTLTNTGKTPAQDVTISPRMVPSAWLDTKGPQDLACSRNYRATGFALFPNKPLTEQTGISLAQDEIDEANLKSAYDGRPEHGFFANGKQANPGVVGCITYYSGFYNFPLQTGFVYELRINERSGNPPVGGPLFLPLDQSEIPASRLILQEGALGGNWAK